METANHHCQRGGTNPLDELPEVEEPAEMIAGRYMTREEFVSFLNQMIQPSFLSISIDEHENGQLYLKVPFKEEE